VTCHPMVVGSMVEEGRLGHWPWTHSTAQESGREHASSPADSGMNSPNAARPLGAVFPRNVVDRRGGLLARHAADG
jgi:hypothetical protein